MRFGEAPIAEHSSLRSLLERRRQSRRRGRQGLIYGLTVLFWGAWSYLVLPLVSLVLWLMGGRLFAEEIFELGGYESLLRSLGAYSLVLLAIVSLLGLWILWNVLRYGGSNDRRTEKAPEAGDAEIARVLEIDESLLPPLRSRRRLVLDLDSEGCLVVCGDGLVRSQRGDASASGSCDAAGAPGAAGTARPERV